jgi:chromosome segregation ATPase
LEERLDQSQPETHQVIAKQNVALKIEVQTLETELKKTKKLTLRLEKELESLGASADREKELEQLLADRERELREMRKNRNGHMDPDESLQALQQAEERVMDLEDHAEALETELDTARRQLEENIHEIDKLHEALQERPDGPRMTDLSDRNDELRERLADTEEVLARREEEREELLDENEGLRLQLEDMQRRREAEAAERSASRAALYESQEEHEVMESEINGLRDRLARAALDLEMREEELDQKQREVEDVVEQFREQVEANDDEWRGELEEQRAQTEELRTVGIFLISLFRRSEHWTRSSTRRRRRRVNSAFSSLTWRRAHMSFITSLNLLFLLSKSKRKKRRPNSKPRIGRSNG